jgi:hypothetical protein
MNCCVNCFRDSEIRTVISSLNRIGDCDFCMSKGVAVYDAGLAPNRISDMIIGLVQAYSRSDGEGAKPLEYALRDDWDIFGERVSAGGAERVLALTKALCAPEYSGDDGIFAGNVAIPRLSDTDFLRECGVVRGRSWDEFSNSIKHENRFHSGLFNAGAFASVLSSVAKSYPAGSRMYRARIAPDKSGFPADNGHMGVPPKGKRSGGRINPEGVGVLYLSSDIGTALSEVRASSFDYVAIGEFESARDATVVNLSGMALTSPFLYEGEVERFAANRKVFREIAAEIAKPLRRSDSPLEYLPTQYIAEFIKSRNYGGVEYASTLRQGGQNLAVFDESLFGCVGVQTVEVSEVLYSTRPSVSARP